MRFSLSLLALALLMPLPAAAYLTPEEVLFDDDIYVDAPPNARNAEAARDAQEAEYRARAEAEQNAQTSSDDGDLHGAAGMEEPVTDAPDGLTEEERRNARILERIEQNRAQNGVVLQGNAHDETLHGGAPLASTGAGTIVTMLALAAAIGLTLRRALRV